MKRHASLRRRIVVGVVCFTVLISLATSMLGYWVNELAEQRVWENMLQSELGHQILARAEQGAEVADSGALLVFGGDTGRPVPEEFARLHPGVHDEVDFGQRLYVVAVEDRVENPAVLAFDISEMERREYRLAWVIGLASLVAVALLATVTYFGAQWLVRPLTRLSGAIGALRPGIRNQQIGAQPSDPTEVDVITRALNQYLRDIDHYVEREHRFLRMASHELRTPIAVISGASEVAIEQTSAEQMRPHVARILGASRGMGELVAMLLALARDPSRLHANAVPVDLTELLRRVIADHEHLMKGKELSIRVGAMSSAMVTCPEAIITSAIGNLIRNAIENSTRGVIHVQLDPADTITIADPGSEMSAAERNALQTRLVRAGLQQSNGIGLDLVARLCEHLGWTLTLQANATGGTTASLSFGSPALPRLSPAGTRNVDACGRS